MALDSEFKTAAGFSATFLSLSEARSYKPRIQVYEIRQDAVDDDLSSSGDDLLQTEYNYGGLGGLKKRFNDHRGRLSLTKRDGTVEMLKHLLKQLQVQQDRYDSLDLTRSHSNKEPLKNRVDLANLLLRNGDLRVTPRPDLRTGAPIHRYVYHGLRTRPETSSSDSD